MMSVASECKLTWLGAVIFLFAIVTSPLDAWSEPPALDELDEFIGNCVLDPHLDPNERAVERAVQDLETVADELKENAKRLADQQGALRRLKEELAELTRRLMSENDISIEDARRAAQLQTRISELEQAVARSLSRSVTLTSRLYDLTKMLKAAMKRYTASCKKCPPSGQFREGITRRFRGIFRGWVKCSILSLLFSVGAGMAANAQSSEDMSMCGMADLNPAECGLDDAQTMKCIVAGNELTDALNKFKDSNCTRDFGEPLQCMLCDGWGEGDRRKRFQACKKLDEEARKLEELISEFC